MAEKLLSLVFATTRNGDAAAAYGKSLVQSSGLPAKSVSVMAFPENRRSLCSVYNEALRNADGEYVALLHDDLSFERSRGWGRKLIQVFKRNPEFSLLGVAGSSILQESGNWFHHMVNCGHIYHCVDGKTELSRFSMPHDTPRPAASMDGVFMMARTEDVRDIELDETTFDRFHFYDAELCWKARQKGLKLGITDAIDLTHFSMGDFGAEWEKYRCRFVEKYGAHLPSSALNSSDLFPFKRFARKIRDCPSVAVLIPTKDRVDLVRNAVNAIHSRTSPGIRYQIYVIDTGSSAGSLAELKALPDVRVIELGYYNFAAIHNDVILKQGLIEESLLLFHNNDVEFVNDTLSHLLHAWKSTPRPGTIGARLHFPNGLLQHGGVRILACLEEMNFSAGHYGYQTLWNFDHGVVRETSGNTFALALVEKELYRRIGGLNEVYEGCFEDVEFNLRAILDQRTNVFCGDAVALHYESLTRGEDRAKSKIQDRDMQRLRDFMEANIDGIVHRLEVEKPRPAKSEDDHNSAALAAPGART